MAAGFVNHMRYRLRTLLILLAVGPVVIWAAVSAYLEVTRPIMFFCGSHIAPAPNGQTVSPQP
jgi:hypothetical protein